LVALTKIAFGKLACSSVASTCDKLFVLIMVFGHNKLIELIGRVGYTNGLIGHNSQNQAQVIVHHLKPIQPDLLWQGSGDGVHGRQKGLAAAVQPVTVQDTQHHQEFEHNGLLRSGDVAHVQSKIQRHVKFIVELVSEGAQNAPSTLQTFADKDQAALTSHSHQLIVAFKYSKKSLHFYKDCRIFCEGVKATMTKSNGLVGFGLIGHNCLANQDDLVDHNGLINRNDLVNHNGLVGHHNGLVGRNNLADHIQWSC
jgi:hypothetical protein